jgi:hypothetical protein
MRWPGMMQLSQRPSADECALGGRVAPEPKKNEISEWLNWMRSELPAGGVELPGEDTSDLFATSAVRLAHRVRNLCMHLPASLRTKLIEAAILHQCWKHRVNLQKKLRAICIDSRAIGIGQAVTLIRGRPDGECLMEAADGCKYVVKFPRCYGETALATEIICLTLAKQMGLPVPTASVIVVSHNLARNSGLMGDRWSRLRSKDSFFRCLGLKLHFEELRVENGKPQIAFSQKTRRYLIGKLVFDILTLNLARRAPAFRDLKGHAEPVFMDQARCLADADWPRFLRAHYNEPLTLERTVDKVRSFEQLQPWIRRARNIDFDPIWELVFNLPAEWYGEQRMLITSVLRKLDDRARSLRRSIFYLIEAGSFPNIKDLGSRTGLPESEIDGAD